MRQHCASHFLLSFHLPSSWIHLGRILCQQRLPRGSKLLESVFKLIRISSTFMKLRTFLDLLIWGAIFARAFLYWWTGMQSIIASASGTTRPGSQLLLLKIPSNLLITFLSISVISQVMRSSQSFGRRVQRLTSCPAVLKNGISTWAEFPPPTMQTDTFPFPKVLRFWVEEDCGLSIVAILF